ncbi:MAG: type II toxin-antitoxin system VapC family toxin [Deltaproteobacteria bacterium]|nr:type II toxin-antitoxin system VapC family toxin [Deltaproteobacteria bacterium]MBI3017699.1 type II toxin-antitoxin system VapC family toxin [Deltaproteobacteria bacterium]
MILLDSSAWIEYFTKGPLSKEITHTIKSEEDILVPTIVIFEVYRKIKQLVSAEEGLIATAFLSSFDSIELTREIALSAADLSSEHHLGMADSFILATAQHHNALLITLDHDFIKIPGVKVLKRK